MTRARHVAVIGGGVAGLSAAEVLQSQGYRVTLFEAKSRLGGRAGSFYDKASARWIDLCQHIGLGCCTEWLDFCQRTGVGEHLRRDQVLHFVGSPGERYRFAATRLLPAPLHLAPALMSMRFLGWSERIHLVRTLRRLEAYSQPDSSDAPSIGTWLDRQGVSQRARRRFYEPVLISALGDSLENASLPMARKVFVDGFLRQADGFHLLTPTCSLKELYDDHIAANLARRGIELQRSTPIEQVRPGNGGAHQLQVKGESHDFDAVVVAVQWLVLGKLLSQELRDQLPWLAEVSQIKQAPITGVHLWLDRPLSDLPHAAILDRLSQWMFSAHERSHAEKAAGEVYHQVIISASQALRGRNEADIIAEVLDDLRAVFPAAQQAQLLRARVVTEPAAVFSVRPGLSQQRPAQRTEIAGLYLAGDWTQTGWPATMEGAVRSGRAAAAYVVEDDRR